MSWSGDDDANASPWVQRLRQAFAQPVERLGDVTAQLLGQVGPGSGTPPSYQVAAAQPAGLGSTQSAAACYAPGVSARDNAYLNKYYGPVAALAAQYNVNPAFPLANGYESGYASGGTYNRTGDAFGMTGGNTRNMTHAASPQQNVDQLFNRYGAQMQGVGNNVDAYINALRGRDPSSAPVPGWNTYNQEGRNGQGDPQWEQKIRASMAQMGRDVPIYAQYCGPGADRGGR